MRPEELEELEEFNVLIGFRFVEAHEQMASCNDGSMANVITLRFENDNHVAVDVDFIDGEPHIGEFYAVDNDGDRI